MPYTTIEIRNYRCSLFSGGSGAKISLFDLNGVNFAIAIILPDSEPLPVASQDAGGMYRLYYRLSMLHDLVDMLRNEKPVYVHFWTGIGNNTHISTGPEPVGEAEP